MGVIQDKEGKKGMGTAPGMKMGSAPDFRLLL